MHFSTIVYSIITVLISAISFVPSGAAAPASENTLELIKVPSDETTISKLDSRATLADRQANVNLYGGMACNGQSDSYTVIGKGRGDCHVARFSGSIQVTSK